MFTVFIRIGAIPMINEVEQIGKKLSPQMRCEVHCVVGSHGVLEAYELKARLEAETGVTLADCAGEASERKFPKYFLRDAMTAPRRWTTSLKRIFRESLALLQSFSWRNMLSFFRSLKKKKRRKKGTRFFYALSLAYSESVAISYKCNCLYKI